MQLNFLSQQLFTVRMEWKELCNSTDEDKKGLKFADSCRELLWSLCCMCLWDFLWPLPLILNTQLLHSQYWLNRFILLEIQLIIIFFIVSLSDDITVYGIFTVQLFILVFEIVLWNNSGLSQFLYHYALLSWMPSIIGTCNLSFYIIHCMYYDWLWFPAVWRTESLIPLCPKDPPYIVS